MKRKLNARTITLISLICALICVVVAGFAFMNLFDSNSINNNTARADFQEMSEIPKWSNGSDTITVTSSTATPTVRIGSSLSGVRIYSNPSNLTIKGNEVTVPSTAGTYKINFVPADSYDDNFGEEHTFVWASGNDSDIRTLTLIVSSNASASKTTITVSLQRTSLTCSNLSQSIWVNSSISDPWDYYTVTVPSGTYGPYKECFDIEDDGETQEIRVPAYAPAATYHVTFTIKSAFTGSYQFSNGKTTLELSFTIKKATINYTVGRTTATYEPGGQTIYNFLVLGVDNNWNYVDLSYPNGCDFQDNADLYITDDAVCGPHTVTLSIKSAYTGCYELAGGKSSYSFTFTLNKLTLNWTLNQNSTTYSTESQTISSALECDDEDWSFYSSLTMPTGWERWAEDINEVNDIIIPAGANATTYNITATIKSGYTDTHQFSNGKSTQSFTFTINKATYDMSGVAWSATKTFTYNGNPHSVTLTGLPKGVIPTYKDNSKTDVDTYTASVTGWTYDSTNYYAPVFTTTCSWSIIKANQSKPTITATTTTVVCDNSITLSSSGQGTLTWAVTSTANSGAVSYTTNTGTSFTITGTHWGTVSVTVTAGGNSNYNASAASDAKSITVQRKAIAIPTLAKGTGAGGSVSGQTATTTYTGSAQHYTISSTTNITFGSPTTGATLSGTDFYATDANTSGYTVSMSINGNKYCWGTSNGGTDVANKTLKIVIDKANQSKPTITATTTTVACTESITLTSSGQGTLTWAVTSKANSGAVSYTTNTGNSFTITGTHWGTVSVTVTAGGNSNYNASAASDAKSITVQRKAIAIPTLSKGAGADGATVSGQTAKTTYTGSEQHFTISSTANITFGTPPTGATLDRNDFYATNYGYYRLSMSIDGNKYCWGSTNGGSSTANQNLAIDILRADQPKPVITASATTVACTESVTLSSSGLGTLTWTETSTANGGNVSTPSMNGTSITITGSHWGTVSITVTASGGNNYNSATSDPITITVLRKAVAVPTFSKGTGVHSNATVNGQTATTYYTGSAQYFTLSINYLNFHFSEPTEGSHRSNSNFYATDVNTDGYTLVIGLNSDIYCWGDTDGGTDIADKTVKIIINKGIQKAVTITPDATSVEVGGTVTLTAGGGTHTGSYTWSVATLSGGGTATLSATTGTSVTLTATNAGSVRVTMYRAGTDLYSASDSVTVDITITKGSQTVSITPAGTSTIVYGNTLQLTGVGQGTYSWSSSDESVATVSSTGLVTATGAGTVTITLTVDGGNNYDSATATKTVTVQRKAIAVPTLAKGTGAGGSVSGQTATTTYNTNAQHYTISSTANITFGTPTNGATLSGADFYATNASTYTVSMSIDGNKYCWGTSNGGTDTANKTLTIQINKANQTVTITPTGTSVIYHGDTFQLTGSGIGTLSWSTTATNIGTIDSQTGLITTINGTDTGSIYVILTASGNENYNAGTSAQKRVDVRRMPQDPIEITGPNTVVYGETITLICVGGNGDGQWVWKSPTSIDGGRINIKSIDYPNLSSLYGYRVTVTGTNVGKVSVSVAKSHNAIYADTDYITYEITVIKATPKVSPTLAAGNYFAGDLLSKIALSNKNSVKGTFTWDNPSTALEAGSASYAWTFTPEDTHNYNIVKGTATVEALGMDEIKVTGAKTNYKAYESFDPTGMVVEAIAGTASREVTGYTITIPYEADDRTCFLVKDNGCKITISYTEGGKTLSTTVTITVEKADHNMSGVIFEDGSATYDKQAHTLAQPSNLPAGVNFSKFTIFSGEEEVESAINAGTYTVSVVFTLGDEDNYNMPSLSATLVIEKATSQIALSGVIREYVYNGEEQTVVIDGFASVDNDEQEISYTKNTFTTVKEGNELVITVSAAESGNYFAAEPVTFTITVSKAEVSLEWTGEDVTYDGKPHSATLTAIGGVKDNDGAAFADEALNAKISVTYTATNGGNEERTHVGTYAPVLAGYPTDEPYCNYNYTITNASFSFKINKATNADSITFENKEETYDGTAKYITVAGTLTGDITATYYFAGTDNLFNGATNVKDGGYAVEVRFSSASGNYEEPQAMSATLTIKPKEISGDDVTGINDKYEYNGKAQTPNPEVSVLLLSSDASKTKLTKNDDYTVSYDFNDNVNVGNKVTVTVAGNGNYCGTVEKEFTITKKRLGVEAQGATSYVYNNTPQGLTAKFTGLAENEEVIPTLTYSGANYMGDGTEKPVNAGTYTLTVTLDSAYSNYEQFSGITFEFKIAKAKAVVEVGYISYNPTSDKLYPDNKLPELKLVSAKVGELDVEGAVAWQLVNGEEPWLELDENSYTWVFKPVDDNNFEEVTGVKSLTAVEATLASITVEWKDGVPPTVYLSTKLSEIREYLSVTGTLEDGKPYGEISHYTLSGEFNGEQPLYPGEYALCVTYNGVEKWLDEKLNYLAVELDRIEVTAADGTEIKKIYNAFELFDTSTVVVTAYYNDKSEKVVTDYEIEYLQSTSLWAGDTSVKVKYAEDEIEKSRHVTGLSVSKLAYDTSKVVFEGLTVNYDGTAKTVEATNFNEGTVSYVYKVKDETGKYVALAGASSVTNAGEYRVVAMLTLVGEEYTKNYNCAMDGTLPVTLTCELVINKVDYAGLAAIVFADTETDYNYGTALNGEITIKNLPAGITVSYEFKDEKGNAVEPSQVVNAGTYTVTVNFTVDGNHNEIQALTATLKVRKLKPVVNPQLSVKLKEGMHLYQVEYVLSEGDTAGKIVWENDELTLSEGINRCRYTFVPTDTQNFENVNLFIDLPVSSSGDSVSQGVSLNDWRIWVAIGCMAVALVTSIIAIIVAAKKRKNVDEDGFYDDVTEDDLKW